MVQCPALFIAAPSSGQGKTTVTAAIARYFSRQGLRVQVFKTGPDYLDPQILEQASGLPVAPLDLWMAGEDYCIEKLYVAAQQADLILVEGAMGLFDGEPSSADLASRFGIPILLLMDVKGMAQTVGAITKGLIEYRTDLQFVGLIANHCGSQRHEELIRDSLPDGLPLLASLPRDAELALPERHLGLVQASEVRDELELRFERAADVIARVAALQLPPPVTFSPPSHPVIIAETTLGNDPLLRGRSIAIARDAAFSFIYQDNVELLASLGAELTFFSPLESETLPKVDAVWLPGGYPELHGKQLASNQRLLEQLREHFRVDKPILAECGGFLYCLEQLVDLSGESHQLAGLLPGVGAMRGKRGCQGMQYAALPEGEFRAHAHHRSRADLSLDPIAFGRRQRHPAPGEPIYRLGSLTATYLHLFFPSNALAIARLFGGEVER